MRTGIFGGTFSPPHKGHTEAAKAFIECLKLDKLLIIPDNIPPHKEIGKTDDPNARLEMCKLAFSGIGRCEVSDIEIRRNGVSYTVDTLQELKKTGEELFLLCGTDMFLTLDKWYRPDLIFKLSTPVLIRREDDPEYDAKINEKLSEYRDKYLVDVQTVTAKAITVSSSELRRKILNSADVSEYIDVKVIEYINRKGLYR